MEKLFKDLVAKEKEQLHFKKWKLLQDQQYEVFDDF